MQRRLRNTLAIAIAGGAVILGTGTAFAASPADGVTKDLPGTDSVTKSVDNGKDKGEKGKKGEDATSQLGGATDSLGGATSGLDTGNLTGSLGKGGLPVGG